MIEKYVTDDKVAESVADVSVLGETVKGAEAIVLTLDKEDLKSIITEYMEIMREFYEKLEMEEQFDDIDLDSLEEMPDDAKLTAAFYSKDDKVVRGEYVFSGEEEAISAVTEIAPGENTEALFYISGENQEGRIAYIPVKYVCNTNGDKFDGSVELLVDEVVVPDADISDEVSALKAEFDGERTGNKLSANVRLIVSADGQNIDFPIRTEISKEGDKVSFMLAFDLKQFGLNIAAEITAFIGKTDVSRESASGDKGISIVDLINGKIEENDPNVMKLAQDLMKSLTDLITDISSLVQSSGVDFD